MVKARRSWKAPNHASRRSAEVVVSPAFFGVATILIACTALTGAHAEEAARPKAGNPLWGVPLAHLRTTVERPLFSPSRRPPPPPLAAPPVIASALPPPRPVEPKRPPFELLGTVIGERNKTAVFLDETTKDTFRIKVGEDHGGWTLRSVHGRQVDLEKDHRIATLSFKPDAAYQHPSKPDVDNQRPEKPPVDVAASSTPDMESYRAALRQRRGR